MSFDFLNITLMKCEVFWTSGRFITSGVQIQLRLAFSEKGHLLTLRVEVAIDAGHPRRERISKATENPTLRTPDSTVPITNAVCVSLWELA